MATLGGIGTGNFIDWYPEAQRIKSARTEIEGVWGSLAANPLGVPLSVFIVGVSVALTWVLYRHFTRKMSMTSRYDGHNRKDVLTF